MKVAIPLFRDDVSPRFGCSEAFLVASIEDGQVKSREVKDVSQLPARQLTDSLASWGVAKVICGGVHHRFQQEMEQRGIEVIWGVIGTASDALEALIQGTLRRDQFVCRGRPGRGHAARQGRSLGNRRSG